MKAFQVVPSAAKFENHLSRPPPRAPACSLVCVCTKKTSGKNPGILKDMLFFSLLPPKSPSPTSRATWKGPPRCLSRRRGHLLTLRLQVSSSGEAISSREGLAGRGGEPPDGRKARVLRIRQPLAAAPSTPGPEDREEAEEEEESRRRAASQDTSGGQATSSSFWAFRRLGLRAPPARDAELGAGRLEGATSPASRRQLRLRGRLSEGLLQWYLTLRRSDAMGTCEGKRRPGVHHRPSRLPLLRRPPSRARRARAAPQASARKPPYRPFPLLSTAHHSSLGSGDAKALRRSRTTARFTAGFGSASKPTTCFRDHQTLQFAQRYFGDVKALPGLLGALI